MNRAAQTDREIISAFLAGERTGYETIAAWIKEITSRRLWEKTITPDEILSGAMYKIFQNLREEKFRFESSLKTYVEGITRRTIIDIVRIRRRSVPLRELEETSLSTRLDPLTSILDQEQRELYHKIFMLSDERCRQLWKMIFEEELSYLEISERLHISVSAIKSKIFRCKEAAISMYNSII